MLTYPKMDPVALSLGPLKVRWYGLMYLVGFATGWLLGRYRAANSRKGLWNGPGGVWQAQEVDDVITYCVLGVVLGGRIGYTLFYDLPFFLHHPEQIYQIWNGGMSFHGGVLGFAAAIWLFARRRGKTFAQVCDFLVPMVPPGLFAGRIGNFINGELWGRITDSPIGMVFPGPNAGPYPRHPSQLYEAGLEGIALFLVLWFYTSKRRPSFAASGLFCLGYGVFRFIVEFFRQPDIQLGYIAFNWLTMGQLLCLPMIIGGAAIMLLAYKRDAGN